MVGVLDGTDEFAIKSAIRIVRDGGAEQLERMLPRMPDKQAANLIATGSMVVQQTAYIERMMGPTLSLPACRRANNGAMWMLENLLEFPGTVEESSFFEEGCMAERLTLPPHQRAQAGLSTGAGRFGMSSAEAKRMSVSVESLVATLPVVLADLSGSLGKKVLRNLPDSELVTSIWEGVRGLRDDEEVTEEEMGRVVPRGWRDGPFRPEEVSASGNSDIERCWQHTTLRPSTPTKPRKKTPKTGQPGALRPVRHISGRTPHPCAPAGEGRAFRGDRDPLLRNGQATEPVRTRSCRVVMSEAGGRFTQHISPGVPLRRAATSGNRGALYDDVSRLWFSGCQHATCALVSPRRRAAVKPTPAVGPRDLPLLEADARPSPSGKRAPFHADRDLLMDIVIERGGLRASSASDFRNETILIDVTYADAQAGVHLCAGSANRDGLTASTSEARKRNHYARPGHVSFDERSHKLATIAVESFGLLGSCLLYTSPSPRD